MKPPRMQLGPIMALVALVAVDLGVIRGDLDQQG